MFPSISCPTISSHLDCLWLPSSFLADEHISWVSPEVRLTEMSVHLLFCFDDERHSQKKKKKKEEWDLPIIALYISGLIPTIPNNKIQSQIKHCLVQGWYSQYFYSWWEWAEFKRYITQSKLVGSTKWCQWEDRSHLHRLTSLFKHCFVKWRNSTLWDRWPPKINLAQITKEFRQTNLNKQEH